MSRFIDLTGKKFNRLRVINRVENKGSHSCWNCLCDCGNKIKSISINLKKGSTKSCGCLRSETITKRNFVHGSSQKPEYFAWGSIISRCYNPKHKNFIYWGGRGITVCDRWVGENGLINFLADMGERPTPKHSIDRIDNNGNYNPSNCRWATRIEQQSNTRRNILVMHLETGIFYNTVTEAANAFNIKRATLYAQLINKRRSAFTMQINQISKSC